MAKIQVKNSADILRLAKDVIRQAKNDVITTIAQDAQKRIREKSNGQFNPRIRYAPDAATIVVEPTVDDPKGEKIREMERNTHAIESAHKQLMSKSYVVNLLNKKKIG
jgi:sugar-specific transcriptional regulator TrmB